MCRLISRAGSSLSHLGGTGQNVMGARRYGCVVCVFFLNCLHNCIHGSSFITYTQGRLS